VRLGVEAGCFVVFGRLGAVGFMVELVMALGGVVLVKKTVCGRAVVSMWRWF
jgi:hypothetical protein